MEEHRLSRTAKERKGIFKYGPDLERIESVVNAALNEIEKAKLSMEEIDLALDLVSAVKYSTNFEVKNVTLKFRNEKIQWLLK